MNDLELALKALADHQRLRIVQLLAARAEVTVTELQSALIISQPLLSWHLRVLRKAGLVVKRRAGRVVYCSLHRPRLDWCLVELANLAAGAGAASLATTGATNGSENRHPARKGRRLGKGVELFGQN